MSSLNIVFAIGPSFNGMLSKFVDSGEQERIQGGSQSIKDLSRIIASIIVGQVYIVLGHSAPAFMDMTLIAVLVPVLYKGRNASM